MLLVAVAIFVPAGEGRVLASFVHADVLDSEISPAFKLGLDDGLDN